MDSRSLSKNRALASGCYFSRRNLLLKLRLRFTRDRLKVRLKSNLGIG